MIAAKGVDFSMEAFDCVQDHNLGLTPRILYVTVLVIQFFLGIWKCFTQKHPVKYFHYICTN